MSEDDVETVAKRFLGTGLVLGAIGLAVVLTGSARTLADRDLDTIPDESDNCAAVFNPDQRDDDEDGVGNTCDPTTGVPADTSWVIFYLRDQDGHPLQGACFDQTEYQQGSEIQTTEGCSNEDGWIDSQLVLQSPNIVAADREDITQTTRPEGCTGGLQGTFSHTFQAGSWRVVTVRYRCGAEVPAPKVFADSFSVAGQAAAHSVVLAKAAKRVVVACRWTNRHHRFVLAGFKIVRDGKVVARGLSAAGRLKPGRLKISQSQTATSITAGVTRLKPGTLKFRVVAKKVGGRATATTRVTQKLR